MNVRLVNSVPGLKLFVWLFLLMTLSTVHLSQATTDKKSPSAQFVLYLEVVENFSDEVILHLDSIILQSSASQVTIPVAKTISSRKASASQIKLIDQYVRAGLYENAVLYFSGIEGYIGKAKMHSELSEEGYSVRLNKSATTNRTCFVNLVWNVHPFDEEEMMYSPNFSVAASVFQNVKDILLVSNEKSDNITIIDQQSLKVLDVLQTNKGPKGMSYAERNQLLFIANSKSDNVSVLNMLNLQKIKDITLNIGDEPTRLELSDDEQYLYILNYGSNSLSIINLQSYQEISRIYDFEDPYALALDAKKGYLYISEPVSNKVRIFDPINSAIISDILLDGQVTELAFNGKTDELLIADKYQGLLYRYNSSTGSFKNPVNLCSPAVGISFNSFGDNLFVSEKDCKLVAIIDSERAIEISTIYLEDEPGLLTQDSDTRNLFLLYPDENRMSIYSIHSKSLVKTIDVGKQPYTALDIW